MSVRYPLHLHLLFLENPRSNPTTAKVVSVHLAQCLFLQVEKHLTATFLIAEYHPYG